MATTKQFRTVEQIRTFLTEKGFLLAQRRNDGSRWMITNFRGGKCFDGTLSELKAHMNDPWVFYG